MIYFFLWINLTLCNQRSRRTSVSGALFDWAPVGNSLCVSRIPQFLSSFFDNYDSLALYCSISRRSWFASSSDKKCPKFGHSGNHHSGCSARPSWSSHPCHCPSSIRPRYRVKHTTLIWLIDPFRSFLCSGSKICIFSWPSLLFIVCRLRSSNPGCIFILHLSLSLPVAIIYCLFLPSYPARLCLHVCLYRIFTSRSHHYKHLIVSCTSYTI